LSTPITLIDLRRWADRQADRTQWLRGVGGTLGSWR
jgi:hypothetical protein